jgi:hypothetical protein
VHVPTGWGARTKTKKKKTKKKKKKKKRSHKKKSEADLVLAGRRALGRAAPAAVHAELVAIVLPVGAGRAGLAGAAAVHADLTTKHASLSQSGPDPSLAPGLTRYTCCRISADV